MKGKTVLVVEDSPYLAESLQDMLEFKNYTPLMANTGKEGVRLALEKHPDLILLDIRLPDIDGYEVYRQIKEDKKWGKNAKITILTASESTDVVSKNITLDPKKVLFKPEKSIQDLLEYIEKELKAK